MDVSSSLSIAMQAKTLDSVRTTLSSAKVAPVTPEAQQDVILQLSTAAQQLLRQPQMPETVVSTSE